MGAAESKSEQAKYIKKPIRDGLKKIAYVSQIAQVICLLPTPEDFAAQVIGEVVSLMVKVQNLAKNINAIVESYSNFPTDFITDIADNVMGTLSSVAAYADNVTNNVVNTVNQVADDIDYLTTDTLGIITDEFTEENSATHYLGNTVDSVHSAMGKVSGANEKAQKKTKRCH